jgi:hypothetical protein
MIGRLRIVEQHLMKKTIILLLAIGLLAVGIGFAIFYLRSDGSREITFEECTNAGGVAWRVDLDDPDICASCADYRTCEAQNQGVSDIREVCPQVNACTECVAKNFPYPDRCPHGKEKIGEISDAAIWFQCCR